MGGRLRYADAIALYENLSADSRSYVGMSAMHMVMPLDATAVILSLQLGSGALLGDLAPDGMRRAPEPVVSDEERREAEESMSGLFGLKKHEK